MKFDEIKEESNNIPLTALILFPIICFATNAAIFYDYLNYGLTVNVYEFCVYVSWRGYLERETTKTTMVKNAFNNDVDQVFAFVFWFCFSLNVNLIDNISNLTINDNIERYKKLKLIFQPLPPPTSPWIYIDETMRIKYGM